VKFPVIYWWIKMMFPVAGNVIFPTHFLNIVNVGSPEMADTFPFAGVYY